MPLNRIFGSSMFFGHAPKSAGVSRFSRESACLTRRWGSFDEFNYNPITFLPADQCADLIEVPKERDRIPSVLGLIGPLRCGSTAFALMLAGHSRVDKVHFQPFKNALRWRKGFSLRPDQQLIFIKDTLGPST